MLTVLSVTQSPATTSRLAVVTDEVEGVVIVGALGCRVSLIQVNDDMGDLLVVSV